MKSAFLLPIALIIIMVTACAHPPLQLSCKVRVPDAFKTDPPGWIPPNGEPGRVRYSNSYEALWWNCIMIKSADLQARCPFMCSGTPAATYGCTDGGTDAANQINDLLRRYSATQVQEYLRSIVSSQEAKEKFKQYLPEGPIPELVQE